MDKKYVYVLDDNFEISEEVKNMSEEELERKIKILEEQGKKEREKKAPDAKWLIEWTRVLT